ncbi:MAG: hypothetical protein HZA93_09365 [Verrucomicrobia bacterium]|nr:hypothetical protein [Verrucomicrobiota bacterium]
MSVPLRLVLLAVPALLTAAVDTAPAITLRMESLTTWAENISRSSSPLNWIDALRQEAHLSGHHLHPLATGLSVVVEGDVGFETVPRFVRNSAWFAGGTVQLRKKFGLGPFAPVVTAEAGLQRRDAHLRGDNSWIATGALRFARRFTDDWRASLTGDWRQAYAASPTFDVRHHRLFGTVAWDVTERWQLTYGRGSLWGDFVAAAGPAVWARALSGQLGPAVGTLYPTLSWETNDNYGPGWVSYRAQGRSDFWWLELSPALGPNTSLPLRYESTYTRNIIGITYRQDLWTLGVLHRF